MQIIITLNKYKQHKKIFIKHLKKELKKLLKKIFEKLGNKIKKL